MTPPSPTHPQPPPGGAEPLREYLAGVGLHLEDSPQLCQALVHSSYAFEAGGLADNERLEFLGDAVLGLLVSEALCEAHPTATEGELTRRRARLVSRKALGRVGRRLDLGSVLLLGRGEDQSGGRQRLSLLGSCLEAVLGALYSQAGAEACRGFVRQFIMVEDAEGGADVGKLLDAKSQLQELMQQQRRGTPSYRLVESTGPNHERQFVVEVLVDDQPLAQGTGPRIKQAENDAATHALRQLGALDDE